MPILNQVDALKAQQIALYEIKVKKYNICLI